MKEKTGVLFAPSPFRPAWWLPGPHLQTLGARFLRSRLDVPTHRERFELPDGDFVDLDFAFEPPPSNGADPRPLVLVLHGLEGSARSGYALEIYRVLREHGMAAVGLNFRSCSGELNRLPRLYHSGETEDLQRVLRALTRRFPGRRRGAIGVSLGGNVLLKYLGESGRAARTRLDAAVAVSVPFDLSAGADALLRPGGRLYSTYLLRRLRGKVEANPDLTAVFTSRGGHIGFVARSSPMRPLFWAEQEAARFTATHLLHTPPTGDS